MEREVLVKNTIGRIEQLPTKRVQEVNDFVEFIIRRTDDALITDGLQQLSSISNTYDFLYNEPELYSVNDLKVRFAWKKEVLYWFRFVLPSVNNGLKVPSVIRVGKIATIDSALVLGLLGELSNAEIAELDRGLKKFFQLI